MSSRDMDPKKVRKLNHDTPGSIRGDVKGQVMGYNDILSLVLKIHLPAVLHAGKHHLLDQRRSP